MPEDSTKVSPSLENPKMDVNPYIGRLFAFISACCFSLHAIIIRVYSKNLNPYSKTHDEMIFTLLLSFVINHLIKGPEIVPTDNITSNILIIRGLIAFPGFSSCVVGMYFLPPQIFIVFNNSNLIFTIFISSLINKKYPAIKDILFIMVYITRSGHSSLPSALRPAFRDYDKKRLQ